MRFLVAIAVLGTASVAAQDAQITSLSPCALSCLTSNIALTKCSLADTKCLCNDQKFAYTVAACAQQKCTLREGLDFARFNSEQCGIAPRNKSSQVLALSTACLTIAWVFYIARMMARIVFKIGHLGMDDLFVTLAILATSVGYTATTSMQGLGLGQEIYMVDPDNFTRLLLWFWIAMMSYIWLTSSLKLSLLFFYLRIFTSGNIRKWVYGFIAVQLMFMLTFTLIIIFQCRPISYAWHTWDKNAHGKCLDTNAGAWCAASITIALDIIVLALPITELRKLHMSATKKIYSMVMFTLGGVVTVVSILRLHTLIKFASTYNLTYDNVPIIYWSIFESCFGVVALCLPLMRPFLRAIAPGFFSKTGSAIRSAFTPSNRAASNRPTPQHSHDHSSSWRHGNDIHQLPFEDTISDSAHTCETSETAVSVDKPKYDFDVT